jgi:hypothetical protein
MSVGMALIVGETDGSNDGKLLVDPEGAAEGEALGRAASAACANSIALSVSSRVCKRRRSCGGDCDCSAAVAHTQRSSRAAERTTTIVVGKERVSDTQANSIGNTHNERSVTCQSLNLGGVARLIFVSCLATNGLPAVSYFARVNANFVNALGPFSRHRETPTKYRNPNI